MSVPRIDGLWELGQLRITDPDLGVTYILREEELSLRTAAWLIVEEGTHTSVVVPVADVDMYRIIDWLKKAHQNNVERNRRARGNQRP